MNIARKQQKHPGSAIVRPSWLEVEDLLGLDVFQAWVLTSGWPGIQIYQDVVVTYPQQSRHHSVKRRLKIVHSAD
jgi:hypothetical protein